VLQSGFGQQPIQDLDAEAPNANPALKLCGW
jgi:hypothetical protein